MENTSHREDVKMESTSHREDVKMENTSHREERSDVAIWIASGLRPSQ